MVAGEKGKLQEVCVCVCADSETFVCFHLFLPVGENLNLREGSKRSERSDILLGGVQV